MEGRRVRAVGLNPRRAAPQGRRPRSHFTTRVADASDRSAHGGGSARLTQQTLPAPSGSQSFCTVRFGVLQAVAAPHVPPRAWHFGVLRVAWSMLDFTRPTGVAARAVVMPTERATTATAAATVRDLIMISEEYQSHSGGQWSMCRPGVGDAPRANARSEWRGG